MMTIQNKIVDYTPQYVFLLVISQQILFFPLGPISL